MLFNRIHLDAKDHVAFDKLESMWNFSAILQSVECNSDILHYFGNGICTEGGPVHLSMVRAL